MTDAIRAAIRADNEELNKITSGFTAERKASGLQAPIVNDTTEVIADRVDVAITHIVPVEHIDITFTIEKGEFDEPVLPEVVEEVVAPVKRTRKKTKAVDSGE